MYDFTPLQLATNVRRERMRFWKEPLAQFLILGGLLFLAYGVLAPKQDAPAERIAITAPMIESLAQSFESVWKRPPTEEERRGLIDDYLAEEVLYREAQKLGLDSDDVVIRRRLRQKMEFLLQDGLSRIEPDEAQLRAFFDANPDRYVGPDRISFQQIYLGERQSDEESAVWDALIVQLNGANPPDTRELGKGSLLPPAMGSAPAQEIDRSFGTGFAEMLTGLPIGAWTDPVQSTFGWHIIRVDQVQTAGAPNFEEVRAEVARDFAYQQENDAAKALIERLKQGYQIEIDGEAR